MKSDEGTGLLDLSEMTEAEEPTIKQRPIDSFQAQAPICPYCHDDHSSLRDCSTKELKKEILLYTFNRYDNDGDVGNDRIRDLIRWL